MMARRSWMKVEFHEFAEDGSPRHKVTWCNGTNTYDRIVKREEAAWIERAMSCGYEKAKEDLNGWLNSPGKM